MGLNIFYENVKHFKFDRKQFCSWINHIITSENGYLGQINLIFCSDEYLIKINQEYLNHNFPTDIITFNYNEKHKINGDLFIGIEQVKLNALEYLQDFNVELARVIFHGILHLIGYNDKTSSDKMTMTLMENKYLKEFRLII